MTARRRHPVKAYSNQAFLNSKDARALRILSEYLEPLSRFERHHVDDTVVFMGSARVKPRENRLMTPPVTKATKASTTNGRKNSSGK